MKDLEKTKPQLVSELAELRRQLAELQAERSAKDRRRREDVTVPGIPRNATEFAAVLLNSTSDLIIIIDADYSVIGVNPACQRLFGKNTPGHKCYDAFKNTDCICDDCPVAKVLATGQPAHSPLQVSKHGLAYEVYAFPVKDPDGNTVAVVEHIRDISERKKAEEAEQKSASLLRDAERLSHIGSWDWVMETDCVTWSDELCNINGIDVKTGAPGFSEQQRLYPPDSWKRLQKAVEHALATGEPYELDLEIIRADGLHIWAEARGETTRDSAGRLVGLRGTVRDITAHRRTEEELFKLKKAVETSGEVVFMTDRDGTITYVNPEFSAVYGYAAAEIIGKTTPRVLKSGTVPRPAYEAFWATLLSKQVMKGEIVNRTKDGRLVDIQSSSNPILDEQGEIIGFLCIQSDITTRKRMEDEAAGRQETLERLHRLSQILSQSLNLDVVLRLSLQQVANTFDKPRTTTGIAFLDEYGQHFTVVAAMGADETTALGAYFPVSVYPAEVTECLLREHKTWVFKDIQDAPDILKARPGFLEQQSLILVPLFVGELTIGYLFLGSADKTPYTKDEIALLETFSGEISLAIHNARLYTQTDAALRRRVGHLEALTSVLGAATTSLDMGIMLREVLQRSAAALEVERVTLFLLNEGCNTATLRYVYAKDVPLAVQEGQTVDLDEFRSLALVAKSMKASVFDDIATISDGPEKAALVRSGTKSSIVVPVIIGGKAVGTLHFACMSRRRAFAADEVSLAEAIGSYLASVVENARLHENVMRERGTLESIISGMVEGLVMLDNDRRVIYFNRAAEQLIGIDSRDVVGKRIETLQNVLCNRATDREGFRAGWEGAITRLDQTPKFESEVMTGIGKRVIEATMFLLGDKACPLGTGALLRDVTKEREVDRMKTEFISIASHELRTPMTAIFGFAELLLMRAKSLPEDQLKWVGTIHRESQRLSNIIEDLLNVSRIEAGRLSLNMSPVSVEPMAQDVMGQLGPLYPSHKLSLEIEPGIPDVLADGVKLQQVLYNLVDNALKYSPQGGPVTLSANVQKSSETVVISVRDCGLGIPESGIPKLFTRFQRIERPETTGTRGTGLGLYIAKSLVEMMKGRIRVDSTVGVGSTFSVSLPIAPPEINSYAS